jgi:hypothetical protein
MLPSKLAVHLSLILYRLTKSKFCFLIEASSNPWNMDRLEELVDTHENSLPFVEQKGSFLDSQEPAICPFQVR